MSGITPKSPEAVLGSEGGKSWKQEYIRGAGVSRLELLRLKLVLALAPIAFLLIFLTPSQVFSQLAERTLSGKETRESGSPIRTAHLSIRNTPPGNTLSPPAK